MVNKDFFIEQLKFYNREVGEKVWTNYILPKIKGKRYATSSALL